MVDFLDSGRGKGEGENGKNMRSLSVDGTDAPAELLARNQHHVSQWPGVICDKVALWLLSL